MKFSQAVHLHANGNLQKKSGTNLWTTTSEFIWYLDYAKKQEYVIVPPRFEHDFGSIPRLFWIIFNPTRFLSYILHDWIYVEKKIYKDFEHFDHIGDRYKSSAGQIWYRIEKNTWYRKCSRQEADIILYKGLRVEGIELWRAVLVYLAVRLCGWWFWYRIPEKMKRLFSKK